QLDAAAPGLRPRELDRSGRRDLAALLRRLELAFSGLDLWIPPSHFLDGANQDRAVGAIIAALELAHELAGLVGGDGAVVCMALPGACPSPAAATLSEGAARIGAQLADFAWPARVPEGPIGIGIDPAAMLLAGADPAKEVSRLPAPPTAARASDASG